MIRKQKQPTGISKVSAGQLNNRSNGNQIQRTQNSATGRQIGRKTRQRKLPLFGKNDNNLPHAGGTQNENAGLSAPP